MKEQYLEVILTQIKGGFKAECPSFPHCEGQGETKDLALQDLSFSIKNYISEVTGSTLDKLILGKDYTNVIINPDDSEKIDHRVIQLNKETQGSTFPVFMKLKKEDLLAPNPKEIDLDSTNKGIEALIKNVKNHSITTLNEAEETGKPPKIASEILFNVLMSLN